MYCGSKIVEYLTEKYGYVCKNRLKRFCNVFNQLFKVEVDFPEHITSLYDLKDFTIEDENE